MIDYSVIIRTIGTANSTFDRLMDCIFLLNPKPAEIIVVLPLGVDIEKRTGVKYLHCEKGMIKQRLYGLNACKTPYALFCDDDVVFPPDFVQKLHLPVEKGLCSFSSAPLLDFLPKKGIIEMLYMITGATSPTIFHRDKYVNILSTTGYSYNRNIKRFAYMYADSLPWTCFYAKIQDFKDVHLEDEIWIDKKNYASMDDQVMFYKAKLLGFKTMVVTNVEYQHLDARTSRNTNAVKVNVAYAMEFNRYVFWKRFIFDLDSGLKKKWDIICIYYYFFWKKKYNFVRYILKRMNKEAYLAKKRALYDAKKYVRSDEYKTIKSVFKFTDKE